MKDTEKTSPLIQTKLNRPPLPVGMVKRPRLTTFLEQRRGRPLTLVSAPAGYGKSTLISCWLDSTDCPSAWVSLDEHDNELGIFLSYFLAAIQTIFPEAGKETHALIMTSPMPSISVFTNRLINELDQIEKPYILVLDDYHLIDSAHIHDLLNTLLLYPPHNMHLVLGTRMDPPLNLVALRAVSKLTEVRVPDLRFNLEETKILFNKMIKVPIGQSSLSGIEARAEGWVTGLRLAALALRHRVGWNPVQGELSLQNQYMTEYLLTEILVKQADDLSTCMLKTSILKRFCIDLCQSICIQDAQLAGEEINDSRLNGRHFLEWLQASNLFVIPLDDQGDWYRYHHLFRDFLQQELIRKYSANEIAKLHTTAGHWYAQNGWMEEALHHLLTAGDTTAAIQLVARQRYRMMNTTQWVRLERWLNLFSTDTVENSAELWMLKTWLVYHSSQWIELPALLQRLSAIIAKDPNQEITDRLPGEIYSLRSLIAYYAGDVDEVISMARKALELVPDKLWIVRVLARMYLGGGLLLSGDENGAYHAFYGAFEEEKLQDKRFKATLLMTACYFHWVTADLQGITHAAKHSIALCQETDHHQILGQANYHLGCVHYQRDNLTKAEELFASVVTRPYQNYGNCYTNSVCGLAITYQAMGRENEARGVIETAIDFFLETGNTTELPVVMALQAEVALMQGHLSTARIWAEKLDPVPPLIPMTRFFAPHLTLVKVWLAQDTPSSLEKAAQLLRQLQEYLAGIHNTRFLIDTLGLQALLEVAIDDLPAAIASLEKALRLAQPGNFIRLFVDLGPRMARLLAQLSLDRELGEYVEQIRSAFQGTVMMGPTLISEQLQDPLTNRELQILELLGERLTNKEIASRLVISPGTVKGHTIRIYQKLDVKNRRQAFEKAVTLGVLAPK